MKTLIKNYGITQSYMKKNNKQSMNELKWNANYDGNNAYLKMDISANGKKKHIQMTLDNDDLMRLLNTTSVSQPIDQRLIKDFSVKKSKSLKKKRKPKTSSKKTRKNKLLILNDR